MIYVCAVCMLYQVIEALQRDTVSFSCSVGQHGSSFAPGSFGSHAVFFSVKAEATELSKTIGWLHKVLYRTVLEPAALKVQAAKLLAEIPSEKRSAGAMAVRSSAALRSAQSCAVVHPLFSAAYCAISHCVAICCVARGVVWWYE